eukprot:475288_1
MILKIIHHMLTFSHLLSLVFYCDYSELSTDFSSTFRKRHSYETIESIKNRNSKYYYLSKYLRECVDGRSERESGGGPYANRLLGCFVVDFVRLNLIQLDLEKPIRILRNLCIAYIV